MNSQKRLNTKLITAYGRVNYMYTVFWPNEDNQKKTKIIEKF